MNQHPIPEIGQINSSNKCNMLIGFGGSLMIFTALLFGFCITFFVIDGIYGVYLLGLICCIFHTVFGFIAIYGGFTVDKQQQNCVVISSLVLGIVGCAILIFPLLVYNVLTWISVYDSCTVHCKINSFQKFSEELCEICGNTRIRFLSILLISFFIGIIDIILSSVSCCKVCRCCYGTTNGAVINPAVFTHAYQSSAPPFSAQMQNSSNHSTTFPPTYTSVTQHENNNQRQTPVLPAIIKF